MKAAMGLMVDSSMCYEKQATARLSLLRALANLARLLMTCRESTL
jgi:hypothetical protein